MNARGLKVRDRGGEGLLFRSTLVQLYGKRSGILEESFLWIYLKRLWTDDFQEPLGCVRGEQAWGLSATRSRG